MTIRKKFNDRLALSDNRINTRRVHMLSHDSLWLQLRPSVLRFASLTLMLLCSIAVIHIEIRYLGGGAGEQSAIQYMQEALLLVTCALFYHIALRFPEQRGFAVLVAGFFTTLLIRELDAFFDLISHGSWVYPASFVAIGSVIYALRHSTTRTSLFDYSQHASFGLMLGGTICLLLFSRFFGQGDLWQLVMAENYMREVKRLVEEGTELMAYCLIFFSAAWFHQTHNNEKYRSDVQK